MNTIITPFFARGFAAIIFACALSAHAQNRPAPAAATACLAPAAWYTLPGDAPRPIAERDLLDQLAARDVVLLGESHDDADHHEWQLQTLAALHLLRPRMVIGFEAFPRRVQPVLDKWVAGQLTVKQFLEQSDWATVWRLPAELYLPLFRFARINRIPMVALNVEQSLIESITKNGWDAVPQHQREGVSRPAPPSAAYKDFLLDVYRQHPQAANRNEPPFAFFVESQTTWDRAMAEALASRVIAVKDGQHLLVVGIMGSGHLRNGYGVPHQLRALGVSNFATLMPVDAAEDCRDIKHGFADAVFSIPAAPHNGPPPPRLGVQIEQAEGGVRLVEVSSGSLAEKSGLRRGDLIVSVAGAPVTRTITLISVVRLQPAGTWLPMTIRRGTTTLEIVIKFPRQ